MLVSKAPFMSIQCYCFQGGFFFFFEDRVLHSGIISVQGNLCFPGSSDPHSSASTDTHHHAQLICVPFVETGFHHVAQAGLELLDLSNLPTSASQSAGITGVNDHTWPRGTA